METWHRNLFRNIRHFRSSAQGVARLHYRLSHKLPYQDDHQVGFSMTIFFEQKSLKARENIHVMA